MAIEIPEGDPINYSLGIVQCSHEEALYQSLLEKYYARSGDTLKSLQHSYTRRDIESLRREAHSLKGSSAYVAAVRLSKSAYRLQLAAEVCLKRTPVPTLDDQQILQEAMDRVEKEYEQMCGYMRRNFEFCRKSPTPSEESTSSSSREHCIIS